MQLRPYQVKGAKFLAERGRALLADKPRVGKTFPTIRAADMVGAENVLWETTGSARLDHARKWWSFQDMLRPISVLLDGESELKPKGVVVASYDLASTKFAERLLDRRWDLVVFDESHRLKTPDSKRTMFAYGEKCDGIGGVVERADRVWHLSGTPAPNHAGELWPMLRATAPDLIPNTRGTPMTYSVFTNTYCRFAETERGSRIVGSKKQAELKARIAPIILRRTMNDVRPEVPDVTVEIAPVPGRLAEVKDIERDTITAGMKAKLDAARDDDERAAILRAADEAVMRRINRLTGMAKVDGCAQWIDDRLEDGEDKLVVFAQHRDVLDALHDAVGKKFGAVRLDGSTPPRARDEAQRRFREDPKCRLFEGQIQAAGEAIDLSSADEVLFAESSYVPKDNEQAMLRIVNTEKLSPTYAWFATLAGSIDERIQAVAARKTAEISQIFA